MGPADFSAPTPPPRRRFFTAGLKALLRGVEDASKSVRQVWPTSQSFLAGRRVVSRSITAPLLRPPGALSEATFATTCERSGHCITACPVKAIRPLRSADPTRDGTPYIIPSHQACVLCDDLACMKACPSGALTLVPKEQIRIGLARVDHGRCSRSSGEPCRECVDRCPIGSSAIGLDDRGRVEVRAAGCTGCGVCELYCPTSPRAITILPLASA